MNSKHSLKAFACLCFMLATMACNKAKISNEVQPISNAFGKSSGKNTARVSSFTFTHPGVGFNTYDLERMKVNRTVSPWSAGYNLLSSSSQASLTYTMQGPFVTVGREPNVNLGQYDSDSRAVLYQAIQFYMTGNTAYAIKAMQILNAWATTHTTWSGGTPFLAASDYSLNFIMGAEILCYTYSGWNATTTTNCQNYFANVVWPQFGVNENTTLRAANQGSAQLKGAIAVAVFNNDQLKMNQVLEAWHNNACGGLAGTTLASGQNADSGRDQGHSLGHIQNLAFVAETAWKQNVDLFGELNNRLLAAMEYFAKYNLGNSVPFTTFGACYGLYTSMGSGQGAWSWSPMTNEIIYGAYAIRKAISAPYTNQYRNTITPTIETFLYRKDGGTPPTPPPNPPAPGVQPSLPAPVAATTLTSTDVGSVGSAGSSSYSSGTWTVNGSGADIWNGSDSYHYAYKQMVGDGVIVARVANVENTDPSAKVGLMIRETLNADAKHAFIYAKPNPGAVEFISRTAIGGSAVNLQAHALAAVPYWLKLERRNDWITAYNSFDGITWTPMRVVNIPMATAVYIGLAVCAHNNTTVNTSTFTNVAMVSGVLVNRAVGGDASAHSQNAPNESSAKAFDGSTSSKWYTSAVGSTGWLMYQFNSGLDWPVSQYKITSANDVQQRDPKDWQFQGSNNGTAWTTLDTKTNQVFGSRLQTNTYTISNTTGYQYYRLNITANSGGSAYGIQLSELALMAP